MSDIREFKLILLGDASVGKSSIIHRYIMSKFKEYPESTLGTAFFCKVVFIGEDTYKLNVSINDYRYGILREKRSSEH